MAKDRLVVDGTKSISRLTNVPEGNRTVQLRQHNS
jgi:hypothetical protein